MIAAWIVVFLACFRQYGLSPGEQGIVMMIASDRRQAKIVLGYINGIIDAIPMLSRLVMRRTSEAIHLSNEIVIEIHTSSYRAVRGYSVVCCIADEACFWRSEDSANPDVEVIGAIRPGLVKVPGSLLVVLSSPWGRQGAMWQTQEKYLGEEDEDILCMVGTSHDMNPTVDGAAIRRAYKLDPVAAASEYGAEWRSDVSAFLDPEVVREAVAAGRHELLPADGVSYRSFCDMAGGSGKDAAAVAVAHEQDGVRVLDALRIVRPPFSPERTIEEFSAFLKMYRIRSVTADKFAGEFPREIFRKFGIEYRAASRTKSEIYLEFLPLLNSGKVRLLDDRTLVAQLCALERKAGRNRDFVDHPPGANDDASNAVCGVLVDLSKTKTLPGAFTVGGRRREEWMPWVPR